MAQYAYIGAAFLLRAGADSTVRRGRVVRHKVTGAYRFVVNRGSKRKIPIGWITAEEWTDDFDINEVEWLGKKPDAVS